MAAAQKRIVIIKTQKNCFLRYNTTNLVTLLAYIDRVHGGWWWVNVYDKQTRLQIANFSYKNPPTRHP